MVWSGQSCLAKGCLLYSSFQDSTVTAVNNPGYNVHPKNTNYRQFCCFYLYMLFLDKHSQCNHHHRFTLSRKWFSLRTQNENIYLLPNFRISFRLEFNTDNINKYHFSIPNSTKFLGFEFSFCIFKSLLIKATHCMCDLQPYGIQTFTSDCIQISLALLKSKPFEL